MFKYISSLFGYKDDPVNQNTQLLNNNIITSNYTQLDNTPKYNCTFCFNSFNTIDEQKDHLLVCKQKPKPVNNIICNRCGRDTHRENNCYEIKNIYGYYLKKNK